MGTMVIKCGCCGKPSRKLNCPACVAWKQRNAAHFAGAHALKAERRCPYCEAARRGCRPSEVGTR